MLKKVPTFISSLASYFITMIWGSELVLKLRIPLARRRKIERLFQEWISAFKALANDINGKQRYRMCRLCLGCIDGEG